VSELSFPDPPLQDAVVFLRPWTDEDLPVRLRAAADPGFQRFSWPDAAELTPERLRASMARREQARLRGEELNLAFSEPGDPSVVLGGGSLYGINLEAGRASVGFWLRPEGRGRGVASHATRLMAKWAFTHLGIARLELTCEPDNEASQRVAARCGFVREGVLRSHLPWKGGRRDTVMFSLLPGELR
jgi:RimJ/RimL family protein N-acetyltransferase